MSREIGVRGAEILPAAAPARAGARVRRQRRRRGYAADIFSVLPWAGWGGKRVVAGEPRRWLVPSLRARPACLYVEKTEARVDGFCQILNSKRNASNVDRIVGIGRPSGSGCLQPDTPVAVRRYPIFYI